jgi:hypothetical protein
MTTEKYIIIVRGLSGSGKTTLADIICGDTESRVSISVDDFFYDDDDNYEFVPAQLREAHDWCKTEVGTCAAQGFEVIVVHNTFTRQWEVEPYLQIAAQFGYRCIVTSIFDSGKNDAELSGRSDHGIEIYNVRSQRKRWDHDVFRTVYQPSHHGQRNNRSR